MGNTIKETHENFGMKDLLELKHSQAKEILNIKDGMEDKKHEKKIDYSTFLYGLKDKFLDKQTNTTIERMKYADFLRRKK